MHERFHPKIGRIRVPVSAAPPAIQPGMRGGLRSAVVTVPAIVALLLFAFPAFPAPRTLEGKVVRVADGDTLTVLTREGTRVKVRLYGIDAPEIRHEEVLGQPYGEEARIALRSLTRGKWVTVDVVEIDAHRRVVGIVRRAGADINREMVRSGYAWAYRRFLSAPYASVYIEAEREARERRLGLWKQNRPDPPWRYKERNRHGSPTSPYRGGTPRGGSE